MDGFEHSNGSRHWQPLASASWRERDSRGLQENATSGDVTLSSPGLPVIRPPPPHDVRNVSPSDLIDFESEVEEGRRGGGGRGGGGGEERESIERKSHLEEPKSRIVVSKLEPAVGVYDDDEADVVGGHCPRHQEEAPAATDMSKFQSVLTLEGNLKVVNVSVVHDLVELSGEYGRGFHAREEEEEREDCSVMMEGGVCDNRREENGSSSNRVINDKSAASREGGLSALSGEKKSKNRIKKLFGHVKRKRSSSATSSIDRLVHPVLGHSLSVESQVLVSPGTKKGGAEPEPSIKQLLKVEPEPSVKQLLKAREKCERANRELREEREGLVRRVEDLEVVVGSLREIKSQLESTVSDLMSQVEGLTVERDQRGKEIESLQGDISAWKIKADLMKEDFESERRDRERMASRLDDAEGRLGDAEEKHRKGIQDLEEKHRKEIQDLEEKHRKGIQDLEERLVESQREREEACERLKKEKEVAKMEASRAKECSEEQRHRMAELEAEIDRLKEQIGHRSSGNHTFRLLKRRDVDIGGTLDMGAWGTVSSGKFRGGSKVAVKQPHRSIMHESTVERMKREASNMARVHHPNLVSFIGANFDVGDDGGSKKGQSLLPFIVIELMDCNLRGAYTKKALTQQQMTGVFKDVAYALHYLHSLSEPLIHRDLSAPNVLLKSLPDNRFLAKVSDFGSANVERRATTAGEGAIVYSAPESFPPSDRSGPRARQTTKVDSYSFGVLVCEVVSRRLPADEERLEEMVRGVARKWKGIHGLILKCIIKYTPEERPSMADILYTLRCEI